MGGVIDRLRARTSGRGGAFRRARRLRWGLARPLSRPGACRGWNAMRGPGGPGTLLLLPRCPAAQPTPIRQRKSKDVPLPPPHVPAHTADGKLSR
jgi:hypothetical protein